MTDRPNVLVVCGRNKKRSRTAESIFKNDNRFSIRSVGTSPKSERKISEKDLLWADLVLVMEKEYRSKILSLYKHLTLPEIKVLEIPDEYEYMDEELIEVLTDKVNYQLKSIYKL
jgi:protein-tyrosine phosphatase